MSTPETHIQINPEAHLKHACSTDVGLRRDENQDAFGVLTHHGSAIYIVADGMGGTKGGAIASSLAVDVVLSEISKDEFVDRDLIVSSIKTANTKVFEKSAEEPELRGMGTTVVGLIFKEDKLYIANVGDSRAYRIRDKQAKCITKDHTLVTELIRTGAITEDQADNHPVSHMLTRSLGPGPDLDVDCWEYEYGPASNDYYLICSDGLYNQVTEEEIASIVSSSSSLNDAVEELVKKANSKGGPDNITAILVEVGASYPKLAADYVDLSEEHDELPTLELEEAIVEEATRHIIAGDALKDDLDESRLETLIKKKEPAWKEFLNSRELVIPIVFVAAMLGGYLLATSTISSKQSAPRVAAAKPLTQKVVEPLKQKASAITEVISSELEPQSLAQRRKEIIEEMTIVDRSIAALDYATKEEADSFIQIANEEKRTLANDLREINKELEGSTRILARWYGRRKKLGSQNALNTATELAEEVPVLGAIKKELDQITWLYLQSVENKHKEATGMSSQDLARKRTELASGLRASAITHVDEQIKSIQYRTAELTVAREKVEKDLSALSTEIDFAKISAGTDTLAKQEQKASLKKDRYELESELEKISKLIEAHGTR